MMIRLHEIAYAAAIHGGRMAERWQARAARVRIPPPRTAASMLRSAWCKPDRCGEWPATMSLAPSATAMWDLATRQVGRPSEEP
jgi:hypothetical protein